MDSEGIWSSSSPNPLRNIFKIVLFILKCKSLHDQEKCGCCWCAYHMSNPQLTGLGFFHQGILIQAQSINSGLTHTCLSSRSTVTLPGFNTYSILSRLSLYYQLLPVQERRFLPTVFIDRKIRNSLHTKVPIQSCTYSFVYSELGTL